VQLELNDRDAALLGSALQSHIEELTRVLARTDQHALQHELAQVVAQLELISARIEAARVRPSAETDAASAR
jgi:hypothetical protein